MISRIAKLPKWAQRHIEDLNREIERRDGLVKAHALLCKEQREWFIISNRINEVERLWLLDKDAPHAICSLGPGDILLVGRKRNDFKQSNEAG